MMVIRCGCGFKAVGRDEHEAEIAMCIHEGNCPEGQPQPELEELLLKINKRALDLWGMSTNLISRRMREKRIYKIKHGEVMKKVNGKGLVGSKKSVLRHDFNLSV